MIGVPDCLGLRLSTQCEWLPTPAEHKGPPDLPFVPKWTMNNYWEKRWEVCSGGGWLPSADRRLFLHLKLALIIPTAPLKAGKNVFFLTLKYPGRKNVLSLKMLALLTWVSVCIVKIHNHTDLRILLHLCQCKHTSSNQNSSIKAVLYTDTAVLKTS